MDSSPAPTASALYRLHKVMISCALLFCLGFSALKLREGQIAIGAFFSITTVGLAIYFRWFLRTKANPSTK